MRDIGIIGCKGIANGKRLPSLKKRETARAIAFRDTHRERAEQAYTAPCIPKGSCSSARLGADCRFD